MKYAIWALITLAVIIVIGVVSHAHAAFVGSLIVWGMGVGMQVYQMVKGGKEDTNLFPYVFQALGVATMMIWQGFFA